ncbi:hypothetical protein P167DRAFT_4186 [Morchella conica CCBAS932]|uniref:Uncharacterized protein n=1 Tax=Morchella conica CCBAS932 TaxID=1392247 RepID=A0A3N4L7Z2_9PEZI|nr:hypothetical protein P167DRAFT_4186 [Morchella conica CCBAS932]
MSLGHMACLQACWWFVYCIAPEAMTTFNESSFFCTFGAGDLVGVLVFYVFTRSLIYRG